MLSHFRIVLVETSHPGNIGAVARAMKNMGVSQLCLVKPKLFPNADASARAAGASDLLSNAKICHSLQDAIADCQIVLGASARDRTISWPKLTAKECAQKFVGTNQSQHKIALVFGRESSGLSNDELDLCHYLLRIPCNPAFGSLNVAAAVQIVCYELFVACEPKPSTRIAAKNTPPLADVRQMELFYNHLQQTLLNIDFLHHKQSISIMRRLRRIYNRAALNTKELDILRGILRFSQNHNNK